MKLYKYYPLSPYSRRVLTHQEVYFSPFISLNDPFEIAVKYTFDCDPDKKHQYFLGTGGVYQQFSPEGQKRHIADFEKNYSQRNHTLLHMLRESFGDAGIYCLSESPTNILMWGHYAGKHRGFCVEFDTDLDPIFSDMFKVSYSAEFEKILYYDGLIVRDALNKKFDAWEYEKEWRLAKAKTGVYQVNPACITRIYLGALHRFIPTEKNEYGDKDAYFSVIEVAREHLPHVKYKNLMLSKEEYRLIEI